MYIFFLYSKGEHQRRINRPRLEEILDCNAQVGDLTTTSYKDLNFYGDLQPLAWFPVSLKRDPELVWTLLGSTQ